MSFGARALIRLGALDHNLQTVRRVAPQAKLMAVIKANAYGHGLVAVARHLTDVDSLAVARFGEALQLKDAGIEKPIVVLEGVTTTDDLYAASRQQFEVVVHCQEQLDMLAGAGCEALTVWLKFDTGMNRLGFRVDDAAALIDRAKTMRSIADLRLMTHLASADDIDGIATREQLALFRTLSDGFEGSVSIANSPAALGWPNFSDAAREFGFRGDHWLRTGLALYGISPFVGQTGSDLGLKPVMQLEAQLIAKKALDAGARVGYGGHYVSQQDTVLGIIAVGYGDGYTRHFRTGTPVLLNGRRVPLIGVVSMDMIAVDLGVRSEDRVGDIATLWGDALPIEEVAPWADTIPYTLVCGVTNREPNLIVGA